MNEDRLQDILSRFPNHRIIVMGDFFLDRYLRIDPSLDEISIETGKTAFQVIEKRPQPGAAGTVCNNLHALQVGTMIALTVLGDDGEGYELQKTLNERNVSTEHVIVSRDRFTPAYIKPMRMEESGEVELNRQDIKNRTVLSKAIEDELELRLKKLLPEADALIVADQVQEKNCGVVTDRMRQVLSDLGKAHPKKLIFADSRERIGAFCNVIIKPNRYEVTKAVKSDYNSDPSTEMAIECAEQLRKRNGKPVFLTLDQEGICPVSEEGAIQIPCPPVHEPIDIVGAGDSTTAGIVSSLASGASLAEAAVMGNLVASVTIRQLGTTGTATLQQVLEAWKKHEELYRDIS